MTIDGGTVEYDDSAAPGTLNESSGDITGPGSLTVTGMLVWTGGTMDGPGTTIAQGGLQIGLAADANDAEALSGRTLNNAGTATWSGGGSFSQADGATFVNLASANFDDQERPGMERRRHRHTGQCRHAREGSGNRDHCPQVGPR